MAQLGRSFPNRARWIRPTVAPPVVDNSTVAMRVAAEQADLSGQDALATGYAPWYDAAYDACAVVLDTLPGRPGQPGVSSGTWTVTLTSWTAASGATSYQVWRTQNQLTATETLVGTTSGAPFTDHTVAPVLPTSALNSTFSYGVAGVNAFGAGPLSQNIAAAAPTPGAGFFDWDGSLDRWQADSGYAPWVDPSDLDGQAPQGPKLPLTPAVWSHVGGASGSDPTGTGTLTVTYTSTAGSLLVLYWSQGTNPNGVTDSAGNTWVRLIHTGLVRPWVGELWAAPNARAVTSVTVSWFGTVPGIASVREFRGGGLHVLPTDATAGPNYLGSTVEPTAGPTGMILGQRDLVLAFVAYAGPVQPLSNTGAFANGLNVGTSTGTNDASVADEYMLTIPDGQGQVYSDRLFTNGTAQTSDTGLVAIILAGFPSVIDQQHDHQQDYDLTATWYQPDTGGEWVPRTAAAPFNPSSGFDWGEQPQAWTDQTWFQPDTEVWTPLPSITQATVPQEPLYDWDAQQDRDLTVVWWQDPDQGWGFPDAYFPVLVPADLGEVYGWSIAQDVDDTQTWYAETEQGWGFPDAFYPALVPQDLGGVLTQPDWSESSANGQQWWQDPDQAWGFPDAYFPVLVPADLGEIYGWSIAQDVDRTVVWYQEPDDTLGIPPFQPSTATVAQQTALWPYDAQQDRDLTQVWWQDPDQGWGFPDAYFPVLVPADLGEVYGWSIAQDVDRTIVWPTVDTGAEWVPFAAAPPFNPASGFDWGEQPQSWADGTPWFQPDTEVWTATPSLTQASAAQEPLYDWDAQQERDLSGTPWFAPEAAEWTPVPALTVDPQPLKQQAGDDEQADRTILWFAPDAEARVDLGPLPDFGYDAQGDRDQSVVWWQDEHLAWTPVPAETEASTGQEPLWGWEALQDVDLTARWYQPEDAWEDPLPHAFTPPQVPGDLGALWQAQVDEPDLTQRWYQEPDDALGIPPFAPSSATVAQQAPLYGWDAGQDVDRTAVWYQEPDDTWPQFPTLPSGSVATVAQQAALWPEQPAAWSDGTPWFAPEESFDGQPLRPNAPTHPDYGWDAQQDRDLSGVPWFAPEACEWTPVPAETEASTGQEPIYGYEALTDLDLSIRWYQPEDPGEDPLPRAFIPPQVPGDLGALWQAQVDEPDQTARWYQEPDDALGIPPFAPSTATVAQQAALFSWDGLLDRDLTQTWFQDEHAALTLVPITYVPPTVDQLAGLWQEQPYAWSDGTPWFQPDTEVWTPTPSLTQATVAQQPLYLYDAQADRDLTVVWFSPEEAFDGQPPRPNAPTHPDYGWDGSLDRWVDGSPWFAPDELFWVPIPAETESTVAQEPLWDWDAQQDRDTSQFWPTVDTGAEAYVPTPSITQATVAQEAGALQPPGPEEQADQTIRWYQEPDDTLGVPPFARTTATVAQEPLYDWDAQADRDLTQTWFQDEHCAFIQPLSFITVATVPQQAPLWIEQPGQERDLTQQWFAPDASAEGLTPLANAPTHPDHGWDAQQDRDLSIVWFAPDASVEGLVPNLPNAPTHPDYGWDAQSDRDLTVVWYQPDTGAEWTPVPAITQATTAQQAAANQQPSPDEQADHSAFWFQSDTEQFTFVPAPPFNPAPSAGLFGYEATTDLDLTIVWFAPEELFWVPVPSLTQATTAQQGPLGLYDAQTDRDLAVVWPTVDTGAEWVSLANPAGATTAQLAGLNQQPDWSESSDRSVTWFQQDAEQAWTPLPGLAAVDPSPLKQVDSLDEQVSRDVRWYQPEDDTLGLPPFARTTATVAQQAAANQQPDWSESSANGQQWFAPDADVHNERPVPRTPVDVQAGANQQPDWSEQADRTVRWYQEPDDALAVAKGITLVPGRVKATDSSARLVTADDFPAVVVSSADSSAKSVTADDFPVEVVTATDSSAKLTSSTDGP